MAQPSLPVAPADGFGMQFSGGSLLRTPGRTSFRSESSEGQIQPEITASGAVAMLPQMEELLDDHVIKRPPRLPCQEVLAARKEFEQWQTRARTMMHAYAAAASQFFLRVAFVAWASKWQRPVASPCSKKTQRLTDLRECLHAWGSLSKRGAKANESLRLLSWSQDRALRRSSFAAWKSETLRLQRDMQLLAPRKGLQGPSVLHLTFRCWQSETSRLRHQRKLMNAVSPPTPQRSLLKEAFHCLRAETAQRRFRKKLMHAAGWVQRVQPRKSLHKAAFACWRIETARQRLGKRTVAAIERQTNTGESMNKVAFAVWRAETSRLQHCRLLVDAVGDWIGADRSAGLVWLTFKVWQGVHSTDEKAVNHNTENLEEGAMGEHQSFLLWKSAMMRALQVELRGARLSETYWMHSAMALAVFRGWSYLARRSARIKVSLSAGNFAVQRLVLGAWKLVVSGKGERCESKPFSTPRRPMDPLRKDPPGSRSTERSPVLSEEHDQAKKMEKMEKNGEANTKLSRPRTLLEQLHWKAAQFSHPHVERPSIPVRSRDRMKDVKGDVKGDLKGSKDCPRDHPKNLPTPNRREPRKADGPKERIARQVRSQGSPEPLAQLRLKLQDLQNFSADG